MAISPKDGKLIYHLTSLDNFATILKTGLLPRSAIEDFLDVADQAIIVHRETKGLNDYVPFHFYAGTPFDGAVQVTYPDNDFVFITIKRVFAKENNFKILTHHPLSTHCNGPLSYNEGYDKIDWKKMSLRDYGDHDCREICMAECLSPITIKSKDFFCVYVKSDDIKERVVEMRNAFATSQSFYVDSNPSLFVK